MTTPATHDYRIAAGWNIALASLVNIETIVPSSGVAFDTPRQYGHYNPGQFRIRGDGTITISGYGSTKWFFAGLPRLNWEYASDTWCSGGYSGKCTIYTRRDRFTYVRCNAILTLTPPHESRLVLADREEYPFIFTRLVALAEP